jgi:hypothetical protein
MTTAEAIRIVREAMYGNDFIWNTHKITDKRFGETRPIPDPTLDTEAGLAEFARVLLWGWKEFGDVNICKSSDGTPMGAVFIDKPMEGFPDGIGWNTITREAPTPQEAFLQALAAAIVARREGADNLRK